MTGIFVQRVSVSGTSLVTASIDFDDGLNVVAGASDTGKSYLASLIDYAFGASSAPREIEAAAGYTSVSVRIQERETGDRWEIGRAFGSARATLTRLEGSGQGDVRSVAARHSAAPGTETLSSFLLARSGLSTELRVRTNARGDNRGLSFRDIAYLSIVHEARIIAERPPFLSENPIEHTPRTDVLRLIVTGRPSMGGAVREPVVSRSDDGVRLEIFRELIGEAEAALADAGRDRGALHARLGEIERARSEALAAYEVNAAELAAVQSTLASRLGEVAFVENRLAVNQGLESKFELLSRHYESDIARLAAMSEAADLLGMLPQGTCPVCGADSEHQRPSHVAQHFDIEDIRSAARVEVEKTLHLRAELTEVLEGIHADRHADLSALDELRAAIASLEQQIRSQITPTLRETAESLRRAEIERDELARIDLELDRLDDLRSKVALISPDVPAAPDATPPDVTPLSQDLEGLLIEIEALLAAWNMPGAEAVTFSDRTKDLVIAGEDRESHGKGVRALTCAAFILGIARHATRNNLPHPGLVVLDSPLVAYREPDAMATGGGAVIAAGVKNAFYESLAAGVAGVQVIIFENEEPDPSIRDRLNYVHFSKRTVGRYGFFPPG